MLWQCCLRSIGSVLATELFKAAINDSPENVIYKQKYFAVRLENDDLTAISEELTFSQEISIR
jgi:hypothetical protein